MRFVLDHDVQAGVGRLLRARGHSAWSASDAGLHKAQDDEITVYADTRGATVLTHDVEFSARRRRNAIGRHVQLGCPEPDAIEVLDPILEQLVHMLEPHDDVFAYVSREGVQLHIRWR